MPPPPSTVKVLESSDGTHIYAEATGAPHNPHVVLLAGLTLSGCVFDEFCAEQSLLDNLYIVRYDVRGHGRSEKPTTPEAYESKIFADDFKAVMEAFGLQRPVLVGWSTGAAIATDVVSHLPPATISGVVYLSGMCAMGELANAVAAPALINALPGLMSTDNVTAFQLAGVIFNEALFANPETVPYSVKCMYMAMGHSLPAAVLGLSLSRPMDVEHLWTAGKDGLPLLVLQCTADGHRKGGKEHIKDIVKPHFKNCEVFLLDVEGRGHALHYECPKEIADKLIMFTRDFGGKDYRDAKVQI
ncbi:alpha/beta-hydrolase [Mycena belliarum]|uniref:Alpha/beta-hydrolase n=1 Tax=Mycena belliarum TaxID=1033014 RepID=A0AAD6XSX1_9AGAR|nr:alpha/beta-hydrolase [Mycena belliae]